MIGWLPTFWSVLRDGKDGRIVSNKRLEGGDINNYHHFHLGNPFRRSAPTDDPRFSIFVLFLLIALVTTSVLVFATGLITLTTPANEVALVLRLNGAV